MQNEEKVWEDTLRRQTEEEIEILHQLARMQKEGAVCQILQELTGWPGFLTGRADTGALQKQRQRIWEQTAQLARAFGQETLFQTAWQERERVLLQVQQAEIWDGMRQVYHGLCQMAAEPYFIFLHRVLQDQIREELSGLLGLGQADLQRMPESFPRQVRELTAGRLTISSEAVPVEGGFLLMHHGQVKNCALHKLMEAWRPEQERRFSQLLFGEREAQSGKSSCILRRL